MSENQTHAISPSSLCDALRDSRIDNRDAKQGCALIAIDPPDDFERAHIPSSINIEGALDDFEIRFDREKQLILYAQGDGPEVRWLVDALERRGYRNVRFLLGGLEGWLRNQCDYALG